MAFLSPSPQLSPPLGSAKLSHFHRQPSIVAAPAQTVSKRDKRRMANNDRLQAIEADFGINRELYSRMQLEALQRDMTFVNRANLYDTKTLDDQADDFPPGDSSAAESAPDGHRVGALNGFGSASAQQSLGKYASKFVFEINSAMEERDASITQIFARHETSLATLAEETSFHIAVAHEEHKALEKVVRERAIQQVMKKRTQLFREKDTLDLADTSSLLLNPTQFTITNNPASPSSNAVPPSNRKTRHGRHTNKLADIDDVPPSNSGSNKRKRKALAEPADADNSPAPRSLDPNYEMAVYANGQENPTPTAAPTIDKLFPPKELLSISKSAWETTAQNILKRLKPTNPQPNGFPSPNPNSSADPNNNNNAFNNKTNNNSTPDTPTSSPEPPNHALAAPLMARTASLQSQNPQAIHVTRSTRGLQGFTGTHLSLQEVRANARNAAMGQIAAQMKPSRFKESDSLALGLSGVEVEDDLGRMGIGPGDGEGS